MTLLIYSLLLLIFFLLLICLKINNERSRFLISVKSNHETQKELFKDLMHEVRTPLMLARNMPELIDWAQLKPEDQAYLRKSQSSLQELSIKLERISEAFQWSQGSIPLQKTRATLSELWAFVSDDMKLFDEQWDQKVTFDWQDESLTSELFFIDMPRLKQAFVELGKNTLFYTRNRAVSINISISKAKDEVLIEYADNGNGVSEKNWERVFDLMFVESESRNAKEAGLGVGLTVTQGIIQAHGGTIKIVKSSPETGTLFTIQLPLVRAS